MASQILAVNLKLSRLHYLNKNNVFQIISNRQGVLSHKSGHMSLTSSMSTYKYFKSSLQDEVAVVVLDTPGKVNYLNQKNLFEFSNLFRSLQVDPEVKAIVLRSAKTDCFVAGAEINMLRACQSQEEMERLCREGQKLYDELEKSPKPVVSAIMGSCLGGGLELVMATQYRVAAATKKTQLGLPEVQLGLMPGAGGTQRLVDLIPLDQALDLMLTGKSIDANKAKRLGLVDLVVSPLGPGLHHPDDGTLLYLEKIAVQMARDLALGKLKRTQRKKGLVEVITDYLLKYEKGRDFFFKKVTDKVMKATKGCYPAPLKIIEVVRKSLERGKTAGYKLEAKAFAELGFTPESKGLIGLFEGMTACKKNNFGVPQVPVKKLGIVGAGLMGAGIAQVSLDKDLNVVLKDVTLEGLARGQQQIEKGLKDKVKKKKMTQAESDRKYSCLLPTLTYNEFKDVDMVVEAVFEDVNVKHDVIREMERHVPSHCIVATNTSAISVAKVAEASKRPNKVIGMHYFSPVDKMMLLEIVTYDKTSKDTIASAVDVGLKQGKVVIVVKDSPGFYTTRCLTALAAEAFELLLEGMDPKELDRRTTLMGFPVGSATLLDEVGVDVGAHINRYLAGALGDRIGIRVEDGAIFEEMVANGYLGRKSGRGVFMYDGSSKDRNVNLGFVEILKPHVKEPKILSSLMLTIITTTNHHHRRRRHGNDLHDNRLTDDDIRMRVLGRFTNQCIMCLQEGVLASPLEGDVGAVFGLGFPPFLGGPFRFTDIFGADKLVEQLTRLEGIYGPRFRPCQLLVDYARSSKKFHSVDEAELGRAGKKGGGEPEEDVKEATRS